jgi:hypothetical protein
MEGRGRIVSEEGRAVDTKRTIVIRTTAVELAAEIDANETGEKIFAILPVSSRASRWGDEIYFSIPLSMPRAPDARDIVEAGELGFWPDGSAFCIFFGKTPVSRGDEIRTASPVNIFGRVIDDPKLLASVQDGEEITIDTR